MPLGIDILVLDQFTSDPSGPVEGQMWFNTTTHLFKIYRNGVTTSFADEVEFQNHVTNTSNPHSTTLEQARSAGATLAGAINMGGFGITNIAYGTTSTDAAQRQWVTDQINSFIQGLDFQDPVINFLATPPGSPNSGDRYIILGTKNINAVNQGTKTFTVTGDASALVNGNTFTVTGSTGNNGTYTVVSATYSSPNTAIVVSQSIPSATADGQINYGTGAWNGKQNQIAQWSGSAWVYTVPTDGYVALVTTLGTLWLFSGIAWNHFEQTLSHTSLLNLNNDDHPQYLLVSGTRAMTGALNMGSNNITNVGTVGGITMSQVAPSAQTIGAGSTGTSTSLNHADHVHALSAGAPAALAIGSTQVTGTSTNVAAADHVHAMPTFAAPSADSIGSGSTGTSTSVPHADHVHGLTAGAPAALAIGGTQVTGSATTVSASDHQHAMPAFAAPSAQTIGSGATGSAATLPHSDHVHALTAGAPSGLTAGGTQSTGTSTNVAAADHVHATPTGTPVAVTDATNGAGSATTFAASDHTHSHGTRGGGTTASPLHALATASNPGFLPQSNMAAATNPTVNNDGTQGYSVGSHWYNTTANTVWTALSVATGAAVWKELTNTAGVLPAKSGKALAAGFAGTPKKITITFATAFADANYAVNLTPVIATSGTLYTPNVESQTAAGFVINMGTNAIGSLTQVNWNALKNGEST